jgi:hypothetical protein
VPVENSAQLLSDISYLPLCGGLTILGLIATVLVYRRRGWLAGARMLAWALLPLALALVGAARALWQVISALLSFAFRLAFSPLHWVGAALLALCIVLFVVTGTISSRRLQRAVVPGASAAAVEPPTGGSRRAATKVPAVAGSPKARAARPGADPEMDEIAEILKQRGIN